MGEVRKQLLGALIATVLVVLIGALCGVFLVNPDPRDSKGPREERGALSGSGPRAPGKPGPALLPGETPVRAWQLPIADRLAPRAGGKLATSALAPGHFSQVAVTWTAGQRAPGVEFRTRTAKRWSTWHELEPLADYDASEGNGTTGTDLVWTGSADAAQVRIRGRAPRGLAAVLIDPGHRLSDKDPAANNAAPASASRPAAAPVDAAPAAYRLAAAGAATSYSDDVLTSPPKTDFPDPHAPRPFIYTRHAWAADESLRNGGPFYSKTISQVHIHHTVSTNTYTRDSVPGLIRGMYRYHTKTLGWNDIGYNFLVDRFGRIWEGRYGGITYPVRGAHTLGFNHRSVGISVIGNFETVKPGMAVLSSVAKLAAWKLDLYSRDPAGRTYRTSEGSDLFPSGEVVRLPVLDGHRDTNQTACPGRYLYARLPDLRRWAQSRADRY